MAQFCFGAFILQPWNRRRRAPRPSVLARRHRNPTVLHHARIDFSRLSRINSSKFKLDDQRPLTVSGGKVACTARRLEHEALGG